jgi:CHAT domain-containing protein
MSMSHDLTAGVTADARCPLCNAGFQTTRWQIVDSDHRLDLVVHATDGSLQRTFCPACIGPGVEVPGPFCIVRRHDDRLQIAYYIPRGTADVSAEVARVQAVLGERCTAAGIPDSAREWVGTRGFQSARDISTDVTEQWPDCKHAIDTEMVNGPVVALLNAADHAARSEALLAHPDLARPNIERFLSMLMQRGNPFQQSAAAESRAFVVDARRIGISAAREQREAALAEVVRQAQQAPDLPSRVVTFLTEQPATPAELERVIDAGRDLADALGRSGQSILRGQVLAQLGQLSRKRMGPARAGYIAQAIDAYSQALSETDASDLDGRCDVLLALSACWDTRPDGDRRANVEQAILFANRAVELSTSLAADRHAEALMEQGILYLHRPSGDPGSNILLSRSALDRAMKLATEAKLRALASYNHALTYIDDDNDTSGSSLNAGIAMLRVFATPEAIALFDRAQQQNLFQSLGTALAKRATQGKKPTPSDLDDAARFVAQAMATADARGEPYEMARNASILATIEADRRVRGRPGPDLGDIMALIDRAAKVFTIDAAPFEFARNELRRAGILNDLADPDAGAQFVVLALEKACRVLTPAQFPDLCRRTQAQLGRLRLRLGDARAAARAFTTACEAAEQVFAETETVSRRAEEVVPNAELYRDLVDTLGQLVETAGADERNATMWRVLEAMERGRARLYLDMLGLRPLPAFPGIPEPLRVRESELISELRWSLPGAAASSERDAPETADHLLRLRETRAALQTVWDEIARCGEGGRRHVSLRRSGPLDRAALAALAAAMGPRVALVSFFVLGDRILVAWLRDGAAPEIKSLGLSSAELNQQYLASFSQDVLGTTDDADAPHAWRSLGDRLFAPFVASLPDLELLVVVPHGELHALPLHALTVAGRPLIEHVPVTYAPSLGVLAAVVTAERGDSFHGVPLVLSHATNSSEAAEFEGEAETVAALLDGAAHHHATRSTVVDSITTADPIHLACHGYFAPADPLASGVVLSDGVLTARDWLGLPLRTDLVTLSACETGQQAVRSGDELVGLARALLQAGAASVLLTLWRVYSDAAEDWMVQFYTTLRSSPGTRFRRARAFQAATLAMFDDPDPRAWAPFVLVGDPG